MITTITDIQMRHRFNFYTFPGVLDQAGEKKLVDFKTETLDECLARLFEIEPTDIESKKRDREISEARHMKRYFLLNDVKWKNKEVMILTKCYCPEMGSRTYYCSIERAINLLDTDAVYNEKYSYLVWKFEKDLLILPDKPVK